MKEYDFIVEKVKEAGALLLQKRDEGFDTVQKGVDPNDIVTSVDTAVNEFLASAIKAAYPDDRIYSEEGTESTGGSDREWTIDPIDGSSNFSRGIPHFAVCLGLLDKGRPVAGAIYNPVTRELFSFEAGRGAFLNGAPIRVSEVTGLKNGFVLLHAGRKDYLQAWGGESYRRLLTIAKKTSNLASSSLDACFVAAGRIEANIYGTLSTLDIAPALALLHEAGGVVATATGDIPALSSEPQKIYMANNQAMLDEVRTLLEG